LVLLVLVTSCEEERARPEPNVTGRLHPIGILEVTSPNFHGAELARRDYDFSLCASCHGDDFSGGAAKVSCLECHDNGPTACETCHRSDNESVSHTLHRTRGIACTECHSVPETWDSDGHIRRAGAADPRPAEVTLTSGTLTDGTCSNVYCHGATLTGGLATTPRWDAPAIGGCDRCHGAPPPSHAQSACATCHPATSPHIDGTVQVGRTNGCDGCHGESGNPAPPTDLDGNEFTTALGVGAHAAHLNGSSQLRAPLQCSECHSVPATVASLGHIDTPLPAEVLPAVGWNRASETCGTWCHGGTSPVWTEEGGAFCGSCHAIPPTTPDHAGVTSVQMCASCHPWAAHMDGDVDAF
jgi:predicted CxxxxCH...CXXCH cytochrome family protein